MLDFSAINKNKINVTYEVFNKSLDYSVISTKNPIVNEHIRQIIEQSFLLLINEPQYLESLSFGSKNWDINISSNLFKTSVVGALLIGLLHLSGATELSALVLPALLPLLIDIKSIETSVKDEYILLSMHRHENIKNQMYTPKEIYNFLDSDLQDKISFVEFLETLEILSKTGNLARDEKNGLFKLTKKKKYSIHIL